MISGSCGLARLLLGICGVRVLFRSVCGTWHAASRAPGTRHPRHVRVRLGALRASLDGLRADSHRTQTKAITICSQVITDCNFMAHRVEAVHQCDHSVAIIHGGTTGFRGHHSFVTEGCIIRAVGGEGWRESSSGAADPADGAEKQLRGAGDAAEKQLMDARDGTDGRLSAGRSGTWPEARSAGRAWPEARPASSAWPDGRPANGAWPEARFAGGAGVAEGTSLRDLTSLAVRGHPAAIESLLQHIRPMVVRYCPAGPHHRPLPRGRRRRPGGLHRGAVRAPALPRYGTAVRVLRLRHRLAQGGGRRPERVPAGGAHRGSARRPRRAPRA